MLEQVTTAAHIARGCCPWCSQ